MYAVTRALGYFYPKHVKGSMVNWAFAAQPTWSESNPEPTYSEREKSQLARGADWWAGDGRGYFAIQSTKVRSQSHPYPPTPYHLYSVFPVLHRANITSPQQ